jgi:hypothetical protein
MLPSIVTARSGESSAEGEAGSGVDVTFLSASVQMNEDNVRQDDEALSHHASTSASSGVYGALTIGQLAASAARTSSHVGR